MELAADDLKRGLLITLVRGPVVQQGTLGEGYLAQVLTVEDDRLCGVPLEVVRIELPFIIVRVAGVRPMVARNATFGDLTSSMPEPFPLDVRKVGLMKISRGYLKAFFGMPQRPRRRAKQ